jgi:hypothetical protein
MCPTGPRLTWAALAVELGPPVAFVRQRPIDSPRRRVILGTWQSRQQVTVIMSLPNGVDVSILNEEAGALARQLWQMGVGGSHRGGMGLSARLADALVGDFAVTVPDHEVASLRAALFRLGATMSLTPGLAALNADLDSTARTDVTAER